MTRYTVKPDPAAVCAAIADRFVAVATGAIAERGIFRVALSGGSTPRTVYPLILEPARRDAVDWGAVEFFWGDERSVPPDHPDSNFGLGYRSFISQLPGVRADRVHRMVAEAADLDAAALDYESELRLAFDTHGDEVPAFDLVWLGIGPDGHTASLFPGSTALGIEDRWVVANWAPALETWRMTLTFPVLEAARAVVIGAYGANKADVVRGIRSRPQRRAGRPGHRRRGRLVHRRGRRRRRGRVMGPLVWLALAALAVAVAYFVGWPAWRSRRHRLVRDTNTERYLAWRGRAREGGSTDEGWTGEERRRIVAAAAMVLVAAAALIGFFVQS